MVVKDHILNLLNFKDKVQSYKMKPFLVVSCLSLIAIPILILPQSNLYVHKLESHTTIGGASLILKMSTVHH